MVRIDRVNEQLKREISKILLEDLGDPRIQLVTITAVETSRDLRSAKVYFSVLGDARQLQKAHRGLQGACGIIRRLVAQRIKIRYIPEFFFVYDKSLEISTRIEQTLKEIEGGIQQDHSNDQEQ